MFLTKIELKGFKSFADRIEIDFINGITCIVGPNGSGKSNITDAIRWVLGEQKVRVLRGSQMQDVIFNGTKHRKALNFAEVALYFDNSTGFFDSEFSQICVRRRLHKSGESEYFINEALCRLKDVKELIMDTGIGTDGYSIIGQGNIDNILSDNKFDRRLIFEEAAGIVKFNTKKNESERRLVKVDDNINRINDIINEVGSRIEPLKEESEKAIEFLDIEKKVKESEIKYLIDEYNGYKNKIDESNHEKTEKEQLLNNLVEEKKVLISKQQDSQESLKTKKNDIEKVNQQYQILAKDKDELLIDVKVREEKTSNKKYEISKIEGNIKNEFDNLNQIKEKNLVRENEKSTLESERENTETNIIDLEDIYEKKVEEFKLMNSDKDELFNQLINKRSKLEILKTEKNTGLEYIEKLKNRSKEAITNRDESQDKIKNGKNLLKENNSIINEIDNEIEQNETILKIKEIEKDRLDDEIYESKSKMEEINRLRYRAESEIELYDSMEKNYEGINSNVKRILQYIERQNLNNKIIGIVADLIKIPGGYEEAIAVALGRSATQIVTETENQTKELIDLLKRDKVGRATFLPLSFMKSYRNNVNLSGDGFLGFAKEIISFDDKYDSLIDYLLGKTLIVDNIDNGIKLSKKMTGRYKIVTLDGDVIITNGPITGGSKGNQKDNIFKRKQKLESLKKRIEEYNDQLIEIREIISVKEKKIIAIDSEIDQLKKGLLGNRSKKTIIKTDNQVLINKLENDNKDYERYMKEIKNDEEEIETEENDGIYLHDTIEQLNIDIDKIEGIFNDAKLSGVDEAQLKQMEESNTQMKINYAKINENLKNISDIINQEHEKIQDITANLEHLKNLMDNEKDQLIDDVELLDYKRNQLSDLQETINHLDSKKNDIKMNMNKIEDNFNKLNIKLNEVENSTDETREFIHEIEVVMAKLEVKISNISNNLWENKELSIVEAKMTLENVDEFISKSELKRLRRRMKEIEHVNLDSIQEYDAVKERYEFLSKQLEDLTVSKSELVKFIKQMEKKIVKSFKDAFEEINKTFKIVFSELFGGGNGEIIMTDPDDVLGTDINIMASPPGKKMQNINLLSGGEKALTAIALLFSVLKVKPTPFCILDEIEAALDDSNVYKFGNFLREFSTQSQFILITHRKGTMEYADTLYGVSMQEYGISNVISLKLSDYEFQEDLDD
ncbi:MAG: chromosome segregation protein SMC [Bacillota bacterium]|nr:chromosome segregation protein SMC [Bacillota bacterium]